MYIAKPFFPAGSPVSTVVPVWNTRSWKDAARNSTTIRMSQCEHWEVWEREAGVRKWQIHTHSHTKHSNTNALIHGCKVLERLTLFPQCISLYTHTHTNTLSNRVSVDVIRAVNFLCSSPLRAADDKTTFTDPKPVQENAHTRLCCSWKKKKKREFMSHVVLAYFPTECVVSRVTKGGDLCVCAPLRLCYRQTGTGAECV